MARKSLVITIVAHLPYIRHERAQRQLRPDPNDIFRDETEHEISGADNFPAAQAPVDARIPVEQELLFSAISETYLPLLKMFRRLDADGVPFRVVIVFSPTLCSLLSDPAVQAQYADWLDRLIKFGEAETGRCSKDGKKLLLAERYTRAAKENRDIFVNEFNGNILNGFKSYAELGKIELMATCATYAFLPHYADIGEAVNAQIEVGLMSHKKHFLVAPDGFWLPLMGYTPGIEKALRAYGVNYTILETHGVLFARPIPRAGIFAPVRCGNALAAFARDHYSYTQVLGQEGFSSNPVYRNQNRDIAFEESAEYLEYLFPQKDGARIASGYKYWSKKGADGKDEAALYDAGAALAQAKNDARDFLREKQTRLAAAAGHSGADDVLLMCAFNANTFGGVWHEGIAWLEEIFREAAAPQNGDSLHISACLQLLDNQASLQKVEPYPSAGSGSGYGEDLLDNSNASVIRYARKTCARMLELAERFSDDRGLKVRTLNLAAKETLLAMSSDWPRMLNRRFYAEYAGKRFSEFILAFSTVFDSLGSNSISTEWLTKYEKLHPVFSDINYRIFSKKRG